MSKNLAARLVAYSPDGDRIGFLAEPASWQASLPVNDVSALSVDYPSAAQNASLLVNPCEVAIEVFDDDRWVEPHNARYRRLEVSRDPAKQGADVPSYTMPGYAGVMEGVLVIPPKFNKTSGDLYDSDGKRKFLSASVGQILQTVLEEARQAVEDLAPGLKLAFTPATDAAGKAWSRRVTIYYQPGLSLLSVLQNLAEQGQCDWWMQGRTLHVVNPDSTAKRTGQRLTGNVFETPVRASLAGLLHTAFLIGDRQTWRLDNPSAARPWGATMRVLTQGGVKNEGTARSLMATELAAGSAERIEYTRSAPVYQTDSLPLVDYQPGDWVKAMGADGKWQDMRIFQATLDFSSSGLKCNLTLNDRFIDAQVRSAKRTKGIVNGASGDAGTGTLPANASKARPAAPQGLVAESEGYWSEDGQARSLVRVSWAAVEKDIHGNALNAREYIVQVNGLQMRVTDLHATFDNLSCGRNANVWVSAVSSEDVSGYWSGVTLKTEYPLQRLDPPTKFSVSCELGIVTLGWDGKLQNASGGNVYAPPRHFSHVKVYETDSFGGNANLIGTMQGGYLVLNRQDQSGKELYFAGRAVDILGVESDLGPIRSIKSSSMVTDALAEADAKIEAESKKANDEIARLDKAIRDAANRPIDSSNLEFTSETWKKLMKVAGAATINGDLLLPGTIGGDKLAAHSVATNKLTISSPENLLPNGAGEHRDAWNHPAGAAFVSANGRMNLLPKVGEWAYIGSAEGAQVSPGEKYVVEVDCYGPAIVDWTVRFSDEKNMNLENNIRNKLAYPGGFSNDAKKSIILTAPDKARRLEVGFKPTAHPTHGAFYVDYAVRVRPAVGAELIVDGAISAKHLTVDSAMVGKIMTDQLMAGRVKAGMLDTEALNFKTAKGMSLISPTLRTSDSWNRGIVVSGNNLTGYDQNGRQKLSFNGTTGEFKVGGDKLVVSPGGDLSIAGDFTTSATDYPRLEIKEKAFSNALGMSLLLDKDSSHSNSAQILMFTGGGSGAYQRGSIWMRSAKDSYMGVDEWGESNLILNGPGSGDMSHGFAQSQGAYYKFLTRFYCDRNVARLEANPGKNTPGSSTKVSVDNDGKIKLVGMSAGSSSMSLSINSDWSVHYAGSLRRLKTDINDLVGDSYSVLRLRPVTYRNREDTSEINFGLIAEEVQQASLVSPELSPLMQFMRGELAGVAYDRLPILFIPLLRDLVRRINQLEGKHE